MSTALATRGRGRTFITSAGDEYALGLVGLARSFAYYHRSDQLIVIRRRSRPDRFWDDVLREAGALVVEMDFSCLDGLVQAWQRGTRTKIRYGHETFLKLALPHLRAEPFWWIDADVIVRSEIDDGALHESAAPCALVPHPWPRSSCFSGLDCHEVAMIVEEHSQDIAGVRSDQTSLNGGLCWFNPKAFLRDGLSDAIDAAVTDLAQVLVRADESVLNLLFRRFGVRALRAGLQAFVHASAATEEDFERALEAATVHFTGPIKPWMQGYPLEGSVALYRRWVGDLWCRSTTVPSVAI